MQLIIGAIVFIIGLPLICWGIWNEEKLIAWEDEHLFKKD